MQERMFHPSGHAFERGAVAHAHTLLLRRMEVDSLALGLRVVMRVSDLVVADGDRFNIGGDDRDFAGVAGDTVVV